MSELIQKLRKNRIGGLAVFDIATALLGMIAVALLLRKYFFPKYDLYKTVGIAVVLTFPVAILVHYALGIQTTLNTKLGL